MQNELAFTIKNHYKLAEITRAYALVSEILLTLTAANLMNIHI